MSQIEVVSILSEQLGKPVHAERIPRELWEQDAMLSGLSDYKIATLLKMFDYYEVYGFRGSPTVLSWLLNRTPTNFDDFVQRTSEQLMSTPM